MPTQIFDPLLFGLFAIFYCEVVEVLHIIWITDPYWAYISKILLLLFGLFFSF